MEVPYGEGPATRTGPESCVVGREVGGEALTGDVQAGYRAAKTTRHRECDGHSGVPTLWNEAEGHVRGVANARHQGTPRGQRPRACT